MSIMRPASRVQTRLYKATGGKIGGRMGSMKIALLTTTGRKSGKPRTTPVSWFPYGENIVVVASANGEDVHPAWYLNLTANPNVTVQRGREVQQMVARTASPEEKAMIWPTIVERAKVFQGYQEKTKRDIPVVVLTSEG